MQLPYTENLEIRSLSRLFDNMSESYKIFWFQAILNKVVEGKEILTYDELVDEMITDAWYMVTEYKLNLGPADGLEGLIHDIFRVSGLRSIEKKEHVIAFLEQCQDKEILKKKRNLTRNVPYRLQAPFLNNVKGRDWKKPEKELAAKINQEKRLVYYFTIVQGLKSKISLQEEWIQYIKENQEILKGWVQYHLVEYLQRRNPNVPGIIHKLYAPQTRKLGKVIKYWKTVAEVRSLKDIYTGTELSPQMISIDHFIPWSYVVHDEFWNLVPTTKSANSSKGNRLPKWEEYFTGLCRIEYIAYQTVWTNASVYDIFEKCQKEHINSNEVRMKLYRQGIGEREFCSGLEGILLPLYQSAHNVGFQEWVYGDRESDFNVL